MKVKSKKVFIIGLGQIGGSIAQALTKNRSVANVSGYDIDETVAGVAAENGFINERAGSLAAGINKADIIVLATPIRITMKLIPEIIKHTGKNQIMLDVAGIQAGILEIVSRSDCQTDYISGHPIAGNEGTGLKSSSADKFDNSVFFLSPAESVKEESVDIIVELIKSLDALPVIIDPQKHDSLISMTINLPYLIALTLMNLASKQEKTVENMWRLAGGSFKGATRVASSSPELTLDMFMSNRENILKIFDKFQSELYEIVELIRNNDEVALKDRIVRAKSQKEHMIKVQNG